MRTVLITVALFMTALSAHAQEAEDLGAPEQIENLDGLDRDDRAGPRTVSVMRPAALLMAGADRNGDYVITTAEITTLIPQAFARADRNTNGSLSLFELTDWRKAALGSEDAVPGQFDFDPNMDKRVTKDEFSDALTRLFERTDEDKDGTIRFSDLIRNVEPPRPEYRRRQSPFQTQSRNRRRPGYLTQTNPLGR